MPIPSLIEKRKFKVIFLAVFWKKMLKRSCYCCHPLIRRGSVQTGIVNNVASDYRWHHFTLLLCAICTVVSFWMRQAVWHMYCGQILGVNLWRSEPLYSVLMTALQGSNKLTFTYILLNALAHYINVTHMSFIYF